MDNSTNETFVSASLPVLRDDCGRIMDLQFTNDYPSVIWITRISFPILLVIGAIGNSFGCVLAWRSKRGSQRTFLLGMYITSFLYMWSQLVIYIGNGTWDDPNPEELYGRFYKLTAGFWLYLGETLYLASQGVLLVFSVDRCIAVTFPLHHYTRKRRFYGLVVLVGVFIFAAANSLILPVLYYWNLTGGTVELGGYIRVLPTSLRQWRKLDMWWEAIFAVAVYVIIFASNLILVQSLRTQSRRNSTDSTTGLSAERSDSSSTNHGILINSINKCVPNATRSQLLLVSSLFYLITQSLKVVMCILVISNAAPICLFQITMDFLLVYDPINVLLVQFYFAFGFVFLIWLGTAERKQLLKSCVSATRC